MQSRAIPVRIVCGFSHCSCVILGWSHYDKRGITQELWDSDRNGTWSHEVHCSVIWAHSFCMGSNCTAKAISFRSLLYEYLCKCSVWAWIAPSMQPYIKLLGGAQNSSLSLMIYFHFKAGYTLYNFCCSISLRLGSHHHRIRLTARGPVRPGSTFRVRFQPEF